ncbi:hypothetical protein B0H63DRAFT_467887 [Podospora didyma]|uniref:Zn(2)-C6 fungal-type domain-containing protein n=1 Tax=Podospora didyma TaxID=330526 RepID=A0AAE0NRX1_9PEZI|nr:hypothetical protein B0H63DRAFT_467887 [Podospora didyma]
MTPKIKYRATCDGCADSKVRCDKKRPLCGRCTRTGNACNYSMSLRTGRAAVNRLLQTQPLISDSTSSLSSTIKVGTEEKTPDKSSYPDLASPPGANTSEPPSSIIMDANLSPTSSAVTYSIAIASPTQTAVSSGDFTQELDAFLQFHSQLPATSVSTASQASDADMLWQDMTQLDSSSDMINLFWSSTESSNAQQSPTDNSLAALAAPMNIDPQIKAMDDSGSQPASKQLPVSQLRHNCAAEAKMWLHRLNLLTPIRPENHDKIPGSPPSELYTPPCPPMDTPVDHALVVCSSVRKQLLEILRCPYRHDAHLPFLVAVTFSKTLMVYSAVADLGDPTLSRDTLPDTLQESHHEPPPNLQETQQGYRSVALRVGSYDIEDDQFGKQLKAQLILHELSKMKDIEELFWEKYCGGGDRGTGNSSIYVALGAFVKDRLAKTIQGCELRRDSLSDASCRDQCHSECEEIRVRSM